MNIKEYGVHDGTVLVSIIVPCYNQGQWIQECLDSIFAQTYKNIEVIVVDDGSTDVATREILAKLPFSRLRVFRQDNGGVAEARNFGIRNAHGALIVPVDADDKIAPEFVELGVSAFAHDEELGIFGGRAEFFGDQKGPVIDYEYQFPWILARNSLVCSQMFRKSDWEKVGGYNSNMIYCIEDWDFWLSLIALGVKVKQSPKTLLYYRKHGHSRSDIRERQESIMRVQIVENHAALYARYPDFRDYLLTHRHSRHHQIIKIAIGLLCWFVPSHNMRERLRNIYKNIP